MAIEHITDETQLDDLKSKNSKVIVDCYAEWCGPCTMMAPKFEAWAQKYPSVKFFKVNVEEAEDLAEILNVESIPTFLFYKDGKLVDKFMGGDAGKLEPKITQFCA